MSVVVVTHSLQILRLADRVLLMGQDGQVIDSGPYAELATRQEYFPQHQSGKSSQPSASPGDPPAQVKELEVSRGEYASQLKTKVDDLRRKQGDWRPFRYYLGAMGWLGVGTFVTGISLYMVLNAIFGVWLVWWAEDAHGGRGLGYWLGLYATWAILITIGILITPILEQKAPIVSLFLDSIQGITTIHSFGWSSAYVQKSYHLLDSCQKPLYTLYCVQRWLILVLSLIATGTELIVIGAAIALRTKVSAGLVGLAVVHVTTLAKSLCDLVMQWTDMETSLGAVSRIYTFSCQIPREVQSDQPSSNLMEGWPLRGSITFENVSATYEDTATGLEVPPKLALDSITFNVKPGEKLGICGRTGSGKSSLMAALLQILPCYQGRILIDGTELSTLHCEDVQSKLNYVTQEPFLFDGTMRENLSPWHVTIADYDMTAALEKVTLLQKVISLGGLDALLSRDSFSHGERQLFCLARSLLRSSSIVILDEPTGHIDPSTDAIIQQVIRDGFPGRTMIMIAHRLHTLLDFDTAIVLDHGRVKEIGPPKSLLKDMSSTFNALYHAAEGSVTNEG
ncbi:hypothetical protein NW766_008508 [Fusarium irregulare]|uniref:ABC transporter n=1 Tax=Fusarium irregulare TaxID=2494466 RepID=A0A9W8U7X6_9HYPO|nr:hypothetical protein NW766_008508 [Fusarium irregulare]